MTRALAPSAASFGAFKPTGGPVRPPTQRRLQRGAALLVAMVLLTVVATLAAGMVWQQWRAVQIEAAERSRSQSGWILMGALDWARLILREHRSAHYSLSDAWAQPLAEARLSTFLAADRSSDGGPEAFLSGQILDAQGRYNLRNLLVDKLVDPAELKVLERLCQAAGLSSGVAAQLAPGLAAAWLASDAMAAIAPAHIEDLAWFGLDSASIDALRPWLLLLPEGQAKPTAVNLNTAPREVLAAVIEGIDLGSADRLVQARQRQPFKALEEAEAVLQLPNGAKLDPKRVGVGSEFFEVRGRLRLDDRVLEELSLVHKRNASEVVAVQRQRVSTVLSSASVR